VGGLFGAIRAAGLALQAQEQVMSATANNVANAQTPGYSREEATLQPAPALPPPGLNMPAMAGQVGTGVLVTNIARQDSPFLDAQAYAAASALSDQQTVQTSLTQVQSVFNEPSTNGLNSALTAFWSDWQALGNDPSNQAARTTVIAQGQTVAQQFNSIDSQLTELQGNLDNSVASQVQSVNQIATQIAQLNQQIVAIQGAGQSPNELLDQRGLLLGKLAKITQFQETPQSNGADVVTIGGVNLVAGNQTTTLVATPDGSNHGYQALSWQGVSAPVELGPGSLSQTLTLRDSTIPGYRSQLDAMANALATAVNGRPATAPAATGVTGTGSIPAGTYQVGYSIVTPQGETAVSPTTSVTLGSAGEITFPPVTVPSGDTVNYYMTNGGGSTMYLAASGSGGSPVTVTGLPTGPAAPTPTLGQWGGQALGGSGPTLTQFFDGSTAASLQVDAAVAGNPSLVAAASVGGGAGDGSNALAIADIQNQPWVGTSTIGAAYGSLIAGMGEQASAANDAVQTQQLLANRIQQEQSSVSGVDLNEELTNMVSAQQAYGAAADVINVVNQMLGALISTV
jgi:flagellar hook-associated protein 1 FlgK